MPARFGVLLAGMGLAWGFGISTPGASGQEPEPEVPSFARELPAIRSGEPIFRFNGKDLAGFYPFVRDRGRNDPKHVFSVRDGKIDISGEEFGGLTTQDEFRNYHLITEWKWGERTWAPRKKNARATRESWCTASGRTAPRAATGWSRRSVRSSREAAATSSWSPGGRSPS